MNWAKQATVTLISPLLVAWCLNPHALHAQQPSSAAGSETTGGHASGTTGGHSPATKALQGAGRVNAPSGSASWTAGKSSFGTGPQQNGIWRDPAVPYPSVVTAPRPGSGPMAMPETHAALNTSSSSNATAGRLSSPKPSKPSTVRGSAAPGTSRTAHVSLAGAESKPGGLHKAFGSKPSASKKTDRSHPSQGSRKTWKPPFGTAKPTEQKPRTRPPISTSLEDDFGEGQGGIGHKVEP
jgi:hypothetical protein